MSIYCSVEVECVCVCVCGAELSPPPSMPAWRVQEQLYRYQIALKTLIRFLSEEWLLHTYC